MDIKVIGITHSFGEKRVFHDFSAEFPMGELTCLMGPSGSGKTTLLSIMMGIIRPCAGTISGVPRLKSAVFQEDRLCEDFSAASNIRVVLGRKTDKALIKRNLESIGLGGETSRAGDFSGGMKRRVALVRALMAQSDIIFLDEPFKGLDEETKSAAMDYFMSNRNGRTAIMVTHSMDEVRELNGRLLLLEELS